MRVWKDCIVFVARYGSPGSRAFSVERLVGKVYLGHRRRKEDTCWSVVSSMDLVYTSYVDCLSRFVGLEEFSLRKLGSNEMGHDLKRSKELKIRTGSLPAMAY